MWKLSRVRKNSEFFRNVVEGPVTTPSIVAKDALARSFLSRFCRFLPCPGRFRAWLGHDPHQLGQPDEVVGSGSQREYPADAGKAAVVGLAKAGGRLGPTKHLLNALAHPPTDRIAGMAGCSTVDCRS